MPSWRCAFPVELRGSAAPTRSAAGANDEALGGGDLPVEVPRAEFHSPGRLVDAAQLRDGERLYTEGRRQRRVLQLGPGDRCLGTQKRPSHKSTGIGRSRQLPLPGPIRADNLIRLGLQIPCPCNAPTSSRLPLATNRTPGETPGTPLGPTFSSRETHHLLKTSFRTLPLDPPNSTPFTVRLFRHVGPIRAVATSSEQPVPESRAGGGPDLDVPVATRAYLSTATGRALVARCAGLGRHVRHSCRYVSPTGSGHLASVNRLGSRRGC